MYCLHQALLELQNVQLADLTLFDTTVAEVLCGLAERYRQTVTLYYNRDGHCVSVGHGDETITDRHLRHRKTNRLSHVRALRVVPPGTKVPRGRDQRETATACLDCMVLLQPSGTGVLVRPVIECGAPSDETTVETISSLAELCRQTVTELVAPLERELGKHARLEMEEQTGSHRPCRALLLNIEFTSTRHRHLGGMSTAELHRLVETAGMERGPCLEQRLPGPRPGTFFGAGKLETARALVLDEGLDLCIVGCDVPYATAHRLSEQLGVPVIDRSELILEIFARHATSNEGRLQIRLARLEHELHRLLKEEKDLDRQGGGWAMRGGPGESAAALVKRRIHRKKVVLTERLATVRSQREAGRARRAASDLARIALAGYTNAGKSTLLNALVGHAEVATCDGLFTTLTTTTRRLRLPTGRTVMLSDTVGFIERLPHHLVAAFETTLQESADADLTVVIADATAAEGDRQQAAVAQVLDDLGSKPTARLPVLSKVDLLSAEQRRALDERHPGALMVSAKTGEGLTTLLTVIDALLSREETEVELLLPFDRMELVDALFTGGRVLRQEWTANGLRLRARLANEQLDAVESYLVRR